MASRPSLTTSAPKRLPANCCVTDTPDTGLRLNPKAGAANPLPLCFVRRGLLGDAANEILWTKSRRYIVEGRRRRKYPSLLMTYSVADRVLQCICVSRIMGRKNQSFRKKMPGLGIHSG